MDYVGKIVNKTPVTPSQTSASGVWTVDDAAAAVRTNTWPVAGVPNPILKSLRFNSADSAYLNRTPGSASNRKTWTWSGWVKRCAIGANHVLLTAGASGNSNDFVYVDLNSGNLFRVQIKVGGVDKLRLDSSAVYRDLSAWYHLVFHLDLDNGTQADRFKMYVNGSRITAFSTNTNTLDNTLSIQVNNNVLHQIGNNTVAAGDYLNGYLTEVNFIDGQALDATSFGMSDPQTGVWVPKKYTGTYGVNGFYLNFKDATNTTTLGYDYSGNGNNWTTNNFSVTAGAGNDSLTDVPTPWIAYNTGGDTGGVVRGNYCTLNSLTQRWSQPNAVYSNGNLNVTTSSANSAYSLGTIAQSTGKYYWEVTVVAAGTSAIGIGVGDSRVQNTVLTGAVQYLSSGSKTVGGSSSAYGSSYTTNDVIGVALDLDGNSVTFYKNNVSQGAITLASSADITAFTDINTPANLAINFGQRPFAYAPPAGFLSLCTTNLPTPTILQGDDYFNAVLYTGTGSARSVTGVGFQPDFVWAKGRSNADPNYLHDVVRTVAYRLNSAITDGEYAGLLSSFDSDGFSINSSGGGMNGSGNTYVAWNWKANGAGVTNTAGTITSTVSANTTAGFSIVTYTGTSTISNTVGHGLGITPGLVIVKNRSDAYNFNVWHSSLSSGNNLILNGTTGQFSTAERGLIANVGSSTFGFAAGTLGNNAVNVSGNNFVAYCFTPVAGYSAFGSYTGNGSADGPFVFCGFRPRYVMIKCSSATNDWIVYDSVRNTYNLTNLSLVPNSSAAENGVSLTTENTIDILSNGFKCRTLNALTNASSATYVYAAFAENPFKYSNAR